MSYDLHFINIEDYHVVRQQVALHLIYHRQEVNLCAVIKTLLKGKVHNPALLLLILMLLIDQLPESHLLCVCCKVLALLYSIEVILDKHGDILLHLNETQVIVKRHLFDLFDCLPNGKEVVLNIQSLTVVHHGEEEGVIELVLRVHLEVHWLHQVVLLDANVVITSILALDNHEHLRVVLLKVVSHKGLADLTVFKANLLLIVSLNVGVSGDDASELRVDIVSVVVSLSSPVILTFSKSVALIVEDGPDLNWQSPLLISVTNIVLIVIDLNLVVSINHVTLVYKDK